MSLLWAAAAGISGWEASGGEAAPPRAAPGGARGRTGAVSESAYERARRCAPLSQVTGTNSPGFSQKPCSPYQPLPSDSASQKANGEGASFKVHINLVLVGYSLAATIAVRKGIVPTVPLGLLPGTCALPTLTQGPRRA